MCYHLVSIIYQNVNLCLFPPCFPFFCFKQIARHLVFPWCGDFFQYRGEVTWRQKSILSFAKHNIRFKIVYLLDKPLGTQHRWGILEKWVLFSQFVKKDKNLEVPWQQSCSMIVASGKWPMKWLHYPLGKKDFGHKLFAERSMSSAWQGSGVPWNQRTSCHQAVGTVASQCGPVWSCNWWPKSWLMFQH